MNLKKTELLKLAKKVLKKHGYTKSEAEKILALIDWSEARSNSQGYDKLFGWQIEKLKKCKSAKIIKTSTSFSIVDSNLNNQILACTLATKHLLSRIKNKPNYNVAIKNARNSCGALGYYTEQIAKQGYIGIMIAAADPGVAVYGGSEPILGTNPISIAVPFSPEPILLDMSSANLTWGDLLKAQNENIQLPENSAYDQNGQITVDPQKAMNGSVMTFDKSYKGYGLSLMIQILAGPLIGNQYSKFHEKCQYGSIIMAINPSFFGTESTLQNDLLKMVKEIKASRKANNVNEIHLPGEKGYKNSLIYNQSKYVQISDKLFEKIQTYLNKRY